MRVAAFNPVRPYIGAPLGALVGSAAGLLVLGVITGLAKSDVVGHLPGEDRRNATIAFSLVGTFGAAVGAYLGAAPHQRVAAAVGTTLAAAAGWGAVIPSTTEEFGPHGWQTGPVRALLVFGAPTLGAAVGAGVAGSGAPGALPTAIPRS